MPNVVNAFNIPFQPPNVFLVGDGVSAYATVDLSQFFGDLKPSLINCVNSGTWAPTLQPTAAGVQYSVPIPANGMSVGLAGEQYTLLDNNGNPIGHGIPSPKFTMLFSQTFVGVLELVMPNFILYGAAA